MLSSLMHHFSVSTKSCLLLLVFTGVLKTSDLPFFTASILGSRSWVVSAGPEHGTVSQTLQLVLTDAKDEHRRHVS